MENFIQKLQNKPEEEKKRIVLITVIIVGVIVASLWIFKVYKSLERIDEEDVNKQLNLPVFQENLDKSKPEVPEENNKNIDQELKEIQE